MQDLTTGPVTRHLLKTTSFMLVTMIFQTLYFLVDLYWVGRLGKEAVAAVAVAGNLAFVVLAVTQMLSVGTTTLVSHAAGRKEHDRANVVFNQSILLGFVSATIFLIVAWGTRHAYARALGWALAPWDLGLGNWALAPWDFGRWLLGSWALEVGRWTLGSCL